MSENSTIIETISFALTVNELCVIEQPVISNMTTILASPLINSFTAVNYA
jgi:hypothetical protein